MGETAPVQTGAVPHPETGGWKGNGAGQGVGIPLKFNLREKGGDDEEKNNAKGDGGSDPGRGCRIFRELRRERLIGKSPPAVPPFTGRRTDFSFKSGQ